MKNIIWTKSGHACRSTFAKFGHFFAFKKVCLPPLWMKLYSYWTFCHASLIDLFRLYILFSQYRSCDDTQEIWSFVLFVKKSTCRHIHASMYSLKWTRQRIKSPVYHLMICIAKTKCTSEKGLFGCVYLWILEINSEQYFYMPVSAYLIYGYFTETAAVCLFSFFAWIVQIFYLNLIQLLQNCWEKN